MHARPAIRLAVPVTALAALALAGCSAGSPAPTSTGADSTTIAVVASTNVWGDIATTVGGDAVDVTSIIDDPDKDPHDYEANAQNQLAISKASVVIENGGGYDDFVDTMLSASGNSDATVIDAVDVSGYQASGGEELNEHVWYDFPTVEKVIDAIADAYGTIDPADAGTFTSNASALKDRIDSLIQRESDLKAKYAGEGASITEPVPLYMLDAIGLENRTPDAFSEAVEEGSDVSASVLQETLALYSQHQVQLLAYNEQATGAQTEAVLDAAQQAGVAVVPVTETLPTGKDYVGWMTDNLDAIAAALGG